MNLKTARATIGIGSAAMAAIAATGWVFLVGPATSAIGEATTSVEDTRSGNELLTVQLAGLVSQAEDLSVTDRANRVLNQHFPATADQAGFFSAVSGAAADAGYTPTSLTTLSPTAPVAVGAEGEVAAAPVVPVPVDPAAPVEPVAEIPYYVQNVTIVADGTYDQAQQLLDRIEQMPRSVLMQSVSLTAGEGDVVTLSLTGATFVAPPVAQPDSTKAAPRASSAAITTDP